MFKLFLLVASVLVTTHAGAGEGLLPHFAWRSADIATGARPVGDAAFEAIKREGIDTIVNVDASAPDVESAKRHGLNYIHIPMSYDKMTPATLSAMKRLIDEQEGKVYIHCHHGVHRAPAFAAAALRMQGALSADQAREMLKEAGTSPDYGGLWVSACEQPLDDIVASAEPLPERAIVSSMAEAMVRVDDAFDLLKVWNAGGGKPLADHPDFVPADEVRASIEALEDMRPMPESKEEPFAALLEASIAAAREYESELATGDKGHAPASFKSYQQTCVACHDVYRNPTDGTD